MSTRTSSGFCLSKNVKQSMAPNIKSVAPNRTTLESEKRRPAKSNIQGKYITE